MGEAVAAGAVFVWLGMVVAISFLEAPLKFRAPGVTLQIGLGIGRLVFRALNVCELVLATVVLAAVIAERPTTAALTAALVAVAALLVQIFAVRPALVRRSDLVLAGSAAGGADGDSRSHGHYAYVALEIVKVVALLTAGMLLLAG